MATLHQRLIAMMTKEEVTEVVVAYCDENKISYNQRLTELGINDWPLYSA